MRNIDIDVLAGCFFIFGIPIICVGGGCLVPRTFDVIMWSVAALNVAILIHWARLRVSEPREYRFLESLNARSRVKGYRVVFVSHEQHLQQRTFEMHDLCGRALKRGLFWGDVRALEPA
jgi:membrane protein implicated in regulation of membrane protease activity